jgi:hypothetical protein
VSGWKQETQSRSSNKEKRKPAAFFLCAASDKELYYGECDLKPQGHAPFAADCIFIWITSLAPKNVSIEMNVEQILCEKPIQMQER